MPSTKIGQQILYILNRFGANVIKAFKSATNQLFVWFSLSTKRVFVPFFFIICHSYISKVARLIQVLLFPLHQLQTVFAVVAALPIDTVFLELFPLFFALAISFVVALKKSVEI